MSGSGRAAQLLLAQGVVASTLQLVRSMRDGDEVPVVRGLMQERRRLLALLPLHEAVAEQGSFVALSAAVAESDQTLERLLT
jgi:hypothetical protein